MNHRSGSFFPLFPARLPETENSTQPLPPKRTGLQGDNRVIFPPQLRRTGQASDSTYGSTAKLSHDLEQNWVEPVYNSQVPSRSPSFAVMSYKEGYLTEWNKNFGERKRRLFFFRGLCRSIINRCDPLAESYAVI